MSDNNGFLANYGSGDAQVEVETPKTYKYEQKSGFNKPERRENRPTGTGGGSKKLIIGLSVGGVIVAGLVILLVVLLGGGTELPNFVGRPLSDAQVWARTTGVLIQTEEAFSDEYEEGRVMAQDKQEGTRLGKGESVLMTVSKGPDLSVTLKLPDIMEMTVQQIEKWAADNLMTKVRITSEFSDTVPLGRVIRFEVNDDTVVGEVRRDTPVYVIASKGPESDAATVTVPDFKTMSIAESYAFAAENGITLTVREEFDDYVPEGTLISQSVKAEEKVSKGSEIILVMSQGPMITVPNFSGYSKEKALSVASALGIPVNVVERYSGSSAGRFLSQSLKAGELYESGDFLELNYSLGNKIVVPSFVGQTQDAIESWAQEHNEQGASLSIRAKKTNSSSPKGTIIHQDVANETTGVRKTINIKVSLGKVVYVPDFKSGATGTYDVAVTREKAIAMCEDLGLVPVFKEDSKTGVLPGAVWKQSLSAGAEAAEGDTITLTFAPTKTYKVPSFVGKTQAQIEADPAAYKKQLTIVFEDADEHVAGKVGKVVDQSVTKNTKVVMGSVITLYIGPDAP